MMNPFPGMNPFLERFWLDVHTKLITYIADAIAEQLPPDLNARTEERVTLAEGLDASTVRPDVAVVESWKLGIPPTWQPDMATSGGVLATEPEVLILEEITERWVEITDIHGRVITVIEVLNPTNKGDARAEYVAKRQRYYGGGASVVEIDLLRGGRHTVGFPLESLRPSPGTCYHVCVLRATRRASREVYRCPLREPLPNIRIPLRSHENDAVLVLQPLIDRCYRMGSYWNADHKNLLGPALDDDEAAWVTGQVQAAGLAA